jgi:hypothetical protein
MFADTEVVFRPIAGRDEARIVSAARSSVPSLRSDRRREREEEILIAAARHSAHQVSD